MHVLSEQLYLDEMNLFPLSTAEKRWGQMEICGQTSLVFKCKECGRYEAKKSSCDVRICAKCDYRRRRRVFSRAVPSLAAKRLTLLTFGYGLIGFGDRATLRSFKGSVSRILRRFFRASFYSLETTQRDGGFYCHAHAVVPRIALSLPKYQKLYSALKSAYQASTKRYGEEKCIVWVGGKEKRVGQSSAHALRYVLKYLHKAPQLDTEHQIQWLHLFKNTRLGGGTGRFYNLPLHERDDRVPCKCGGEMFYWFFSLWDSDTLNNQFKETPLRGNSAY